MMRKRFFIAGIILFLMLGVARDARAGYDYKFETRDLPFGQYESAVSAKLTRGLTNLIYGWTELFRTPTDWAARTEHGFWSTTLIAVPYGVVRFVGRTLVGVYETATCYAPQKPVMQDIQGNIV